MEREELIYHIDPEKAMKFEWYITTISWRAVFEWWMEMYGSFKLTN